MNKLLSRLSNDVSLRIAKKGTNLLFQGEIPRKAIVVRDGLVRSYTITSNGEERIIGLHAKGSVLPVSWVFGKTNNSLFYYDTLVDSRVVSLDRKELMKVITSDPELADQALKYLAGEHTASLLRINGLEQSRAIEKIGFTLYYLVFRYGVERKPGQYTIDVKVSHVMLANLVGLTRESATKSLSLLKSKGVIDYKNSTYTVNKARLESFLGEDSFRDLQL